MCSHTRLLTGQCKSVSRWSTPGITLDAVPVVAPKSTASGVNPDKRRFPRLIVNYRYASNGLWHGKLYVFPNTIANGPISRCNASCIKCLQYVQNRITIPTFHCKKCQI